MQDVPSLSSAGPLTLDDVLDLKYLGRWDWSPDGRWIGWLWDDGGVQDLWLADPAAAGDRSAARRLTEAKDTVSDFVWQPGGDAVALIVDGSLCMARPDGAGWFSVQTIVAGEAKHGQLAWSPDGTRLAYSREGALWLFDQAEGAHREVKLPGRLMPGGPVGAGPCWSPDGRWIAVGFRGELGLPTVGIVAADGTVGWRSLDHADAAIAGSYAWIDASTLFYRVSSKFNSVLDSYLVTLPVAGTDEVGLRPIHHAAGNGSQLSGIAIPAPDGTQFALLLEDDGYAHFHLFDRAAGGFEQLTFGECEDFGHAGDMPYWTPDGTQLIYASNRAGLGFRHLWSLDVATGDNRPLTTGQTTDVQPHVSPDGRHIAFVRCDAYRHMDIWVAPSAAPAAARQLSYAMPGGWTEAAQVKAEEIVYQGALGWSIHAQLYRPHGWQPGDKRRFPALVWVHGGPIRQMRPTWHPMHSYALFHAYHQYLLHKGYGVLVINFRGGIGYGRDFRHGLYRKMGVDDVTDVVEAGRYLKSLPWVDPERVAVWGLSYGGYMTLHCLTQYPEEFAMGVNIAGIWDFPQWTKWVQEKHGRGGGFQAYLGGDPEQGQDLYRQGSPCTFKANLRRPLINLHGTADANVDFAQMDRIVADCVELGVEYEAYYYPDEVHTFRYRRSWRDAFPKIERELAKRLRP